MAGGRTLPTYQIYGTRTTTTMTTTTTTTFNHLYIQADRAFGTDSCHDVFFFCFFCHYFTKLGLLFLNRTLLGGMESLRSESGISAFGISI